MDIHRRARSTTCGLLILVCSLASALGCHPQRSPATTGDSSLSVAIDYPGTVAENFALFDHLGKFHELYRESNARAIVVVSYAIGCPIVRRSLPALEDLRRKYLERGVRIFLLDSSLQDHRADLIDEANRFAIQMPILVDESQEVARSLKIDRSGEALLIDTRSWKIIARGPIDDRLGYGVDRLQASENFLADNLRNFLEGRRIEVSQKSFLGCALNFLPDANVTYHRDVEPVIAKKCLVCHGRGLIAPDHLDTYESLRGWSSMLREVLMSERMPPWEADRYYVKLKHDPQLTVAEKRTLLTWIRNGFVEGKATATKKPAQTSTMKSAFEVSMKNAVSLEANSSHPWHYEEVIPGAAEDFWITGMRLEASNLSVIQHLALLVMKKPMDISQGIYEPEYRDIHNIYNIVRIPSFSGLPTMLSPGFAYRIPKGSFVYLEIHFAPSGKTETEKLKVQFSGTRDGGSLREYRLRDFAAHDFLIPAGQESFSVTTSRPVKHAMMITSIGTHMHWHGKWSQLKVRDPNGKEKTIYSSRYIFKNRELYELSEPISVSRGSTFLAEFEYDNSKCNPAIVDSSQAVSEGIDPIKNEMGVFHIEYFNPGKKRKAHSPDDLESNT